MDQDRNHPICRRLLETWQPLTQAMNTEFSWGLDVAALEQLILAAAPVLARVHDRDDARAVLYYQYRRRSGCER